MSRESGAIQGTRPDTFRYVHVSEMCSALKSSMSRIAPVFYAIFIGKAIPDVLYSSFRTKNRSVVIKKWIEKEETSSGWVMTGISLGHQ